MRGEEVLLNDIQFWWAGLLDDDVRLNCQEGKGTGFHIFQGAATEVAAMCLGNVSTALIQGLLEFSGLLIAGLGSADM